MFEDLNLISKPNFDDVRGLTEAYREALLSSHTTQVGAYVSGISAHNREVGGKRMHAESLALLHCARLGVRTQDQTMYAPWSACIHCAQDIVQAGIRRVVTHKGVMEKTYGEWLTSVEEGLSLLYSEGIQIDMIDYTLDIQLTFNGREIRV